MNDFFNVFCESQEIYTNIFKPKLKWT